MFGHLGECALDCRCAAPNLLGQEHATRRVHHDKQRVLYDDPAVRLRRVVEDRHRQQLVHDDVVDSDRARGDHDRRPVVVQDQDCHADEDVEVPLDHAATEVNDHARIEHQQHGAREAEGSRVCKQCVRDCCGGGGRDGLTDDVQQAVARHKKPDQQRGGRVCEQRDQKPKVTAVPGHIE
jgi:hypothetical protein